ncbi:MAG: hypothetical protein M0015_11705 [Betaproteobacteria bacterium]|nr:hypothetical protein [Betaproteobacteria bacterium]
MSVPRLELDYVAAPRRARRAGVLLLVLALALAGYSLERYRALGDELAALTATRGAFGYGPRAEVSAQRLREEEKRAQSVLRQLDLPWAPLIEAVEQAAGRDIVLIELQPQAEDRTVLLTAEAPNRQAMLDYLRRLSGSKLLARVYLVSHRVESDQALRPVRFVVRALLRTPA